jgi:splicing factor 3B subunit 1
MVAGLTTELPAVQTFQELGNLVFVNPLGGFSLFRQDSEREHKNVLSVDEMNECKIVWFLLKIKNSTPPVRKTALWQIIDKAREFGTGPKVLSLLMEHTLED